MTSFIKNLGLDLFDFTGKLVSVSEENYADASFCLSCFMWQALSSQDTGVCLFTIRHSLRHYYHVGMRLGYNLSSSFGTRFIGIDAVDIRDNQIKLEEKVDFSPKIAFKFFFNKISSLLKHQEKIFIIIDNISDFLNLGATLNDVMIFVNYIRVCFPDSTLVVSSSFHMNDEEQVILKNSLFHAAELRLVVKALETGFSKDVTGCIEVSKPNVDSVEGWTKPSLYHYKSKDRSINVFLPGNIFSQ